MSTGFRAQEILFLFFPVHIVCMYEVQVGIRWQDDQRGAEEEVEE